jgi:hypothetical protein
MMKAEAPNTIARPEIAKLMGISPNTLAKVFTSPDMKPPKPLMVVGHRLVYGRVKMLAWIATDPLKKIVRRHRVKPDIVDEQLDGLNRAFISGRLGVSTDQRKRYQLRKIAARHAPRSTLRVVILGCANDDGR